MSAPPQEPLSGHFAERMAGRRLLACVFTSFQLDPGFFEQEVLPVFVDVPLSHSPALRLLQMEDVLRQVRDGIAVYYDAGGLVPTIGGSAKLDVARIPVRVRTGIFHPKNVLALVESIEPDDEGEHEQTLIVASLSANLTRTGWWENVEAAHIEEIEQLGSSRLHAPLLKLIATLRRLSAEGSHRALDAIHEFLKDTENRRSRSRAGQLFTHLWVGSESVVEFLQEVAGDRLYGLHLEVISPFFGVGGESAPLAELLDAFEPKSCVVFLPKDAAGAALVDPRLYKWVRRLDGVGWGTLPAEVTRLGKSKDAGERYVHAKVYRFYSVSPKREYVFVGSPNLTTPGHEAGGNVENAFLVEVELRRKPTGWLIPEEQPTRTFAEPDESEDRVTDGGTRLALRFDWRDKTAHAHWDAKEPSPRLSLNAKGSPLFALASLPEKKWTRLGEDESKRIESLLRSTALIQVEGDGKNPGLLLIQEEGMAQKPSLLFSLSAEDILRYWSLLTDAQRAAFIESRAPEILLTKDGADLMTKHAPLRTERSMFDRFAGLFHAFSRMENAVHAALDADRDRDAAYRLFGQKYDSLGTLLNRVIDPDPNDEQASFRDPVDRYLVALCAGQLLERVRDAYPAFWDAHEDEAAQVTDLQEKATRVRTELLGDRPDGEAFLRWYEAWFLQHASDMKDPA